jgi:hypothetical protein
MEVILVYECSDCGIQSRAIVTGVSVRDHLLLEKRMPEGWVVQKRRPEKLACEKCSKNNLQSQS